MKDRIRQIMESQHMTQQVFADYIGTTPATLSGIFNDRTRPTINIVESIRKKFPDISLDWLMFGQGEMFKVQPVAEPDLFGEPLSPDESQIHDQASQTGHATPTPSHPSRRDQSPTGTSGGMNLESVKTTLRETLHEELKNLDKQRRHVLEIRVYYDDGSYESFAPASR